MFSTEYIPNTWAIDYILIFINHVTLQQSKYIPEDEMKATSAWYFLCKHSGALQGKYYVKDYVPFKFTWPKPPGVEECEFGKQFDHVWGATGMLLVTLQRRPMKVQQQASAYEAGSEQSPSNEFSWALTLNFCFENLPSKFLLCAKCPVHDILL